MKINYGTRTPPATNNGEVPPGTDSVFADCLTWENLIREVMRLCKTRAIPLDHRNEIILDRRNMALLQEDIFSLEDVDSETSDVSVEL